MIYQTNAPIHLHRFGFPTVLACLLACVGMVGLTVEGQAQDLAGDRQALMALYNATDGPNWANNENWSTDEPLDSWHGVGLEDGRVTGLNLFENQLMGSIPTELGQLSQLTFLSLIGNQLTGEIPPELGQLSQLESLDLGRNQLTGPIPTELGNLSSLTVLWLGVNQLTGSIPPELGDLVKLIRMDLWGNQLTGSIPVELGKLSSLSELFLGGSQLTGSIPSVCQKTPLLELSCHDPPHFPRQLQPNFVQEDASDRSGWGDWWWTGPDLRNAAIGRRSRLLGSGFKG